MEQFLFKKDIGKYVENLKKGAVKVYYLLCDFAN